MSKILSILKKFFINNFGFKTTRKLVVIESDDWGSIRTSSKQTLLKLKSVGENLDNDAFLRNDCLENTFDLNALYEVIEKINYKYNKKPIITCNFAMANPDFHKINYEKSIYVFEPFHVTYKKYYPDEDVLLKILTGIKEGIIFPQLHCREHLNVNRWMTDLHNGKNDTLLAFDNNMIGVYSSFSNNNVFGYMDAFNPFYLKNNELNVILDDAFKIFFETFNFYPKTFVSSCLVWDENVERCIEKFGIKGIQSGVWQLYPDKKNTRFKRKIHYMGQKNKNGQIYTIRNCSYEPSYFHNVEESVDKCFDEVCNAFKNFKPAIINSHRFNYISSINESNSSENLKGLYKLLEKIISTFPDVEFVTTEQLIQIIEEKNETK